MPEFLIISRPTDKTRYTQNLKLLGISTLNIYYTYEIIRELHNFCQVPLLPSSYFLKFVTYIRQNYVMSVCKMYYTLEQFYTCNSFVF